LAKPSSQRVPARGTQLALAPGGSGGDASIYRWYTGNEQFGATPDPHTFAQIMRVLKMIRQMGNKQPFRGVYDPMIGN